MSFHWWRPCIKVLKTKKEKTLRIPYMLISWNIFHGDIVYTLKRLQRFFHLSEKSAYHSRSVAAILLFEINIVGVFQVNVNYYWQRTCRRNAKERWAIIEQLLINIRLLVSQLMRSHGILATGRASDTCRPVRNICRLRLGIKA